MSRRRKAWNTVQIGIQGTVLGWIKGLSETVTFTDLGECYTVYVCWEKKQQKEQRPGDRKGFNIYKEFRDDML